MALLEVRSDRCREQSHWFEFVDYVPDFEHQCYLLHFRCEDCGSDTFDKIGNITEAKDEHQFYLEKGTSDTVRRYWKNSAVQSKENIESYELKKKYLEELEFLVGFYEELNRMNQEEWKKLQTLRLLSAEYEQELYEKDTLINQLQSELDRNHTEQHTWGGVDNDN